MFKKLCLYALALAFRDAGSGTGPGVKEVPRWSNRGPRIDHYLETAGEPLGAPYCCSAVYTWFQDAAAHHGVRVPLVRTGYCPDMANYLHQHKLVRPRSTDAMPGDVILFWVKSESRYGHAGIVLKNNGDGTLKTIEANTTGTGMSVEGHQNEGDGVYVKHRQVAGTRHLIGDMQHFVYDDTPVARTQVMDSHALLAAHASIKAGEPLPVISRPLSVKVNGREDPEIRAYLADGKALVFLDTIIKIPNVRGFSFSEGVLDILTP